MYVSCLSFVPIVSIRLFVFSYCSLYNVADVINAVQEDGLGMLLAAQMAQAIEDDLASLQALIQM